MRRIKRFALLTFLAASICGTRAAATVSGQTRAVPPSSEATQHNAAGLTKARNRDFDGAIAEFSEAIRLDPAYADAFRNRGLAEMNKGALDTALDDFSQAIALDPRNASAFYDRGIVYGRKRDWDRAIEEYSQSIAINPNFATAYDNRGLAKTDKGDVDGGIADLTTAIKLDPKSARAYLNRGYAYSKKPDDSASLADYEQAIKLDSNYALAYSNRGEVKTRLKDPVGAIADFTTAIRLDPRRAQTYYLRGAAKLTQGDRDGAIEDFTATLLRASTHVEAYVGRCQARREKPEIDLALADCSSALLLAPKNVHALTMRGQLNSVKGDVDGALKDLSEALSIDPRRADALYERCRLEVRKGDVDRAIADCTEAIGVDGKLAGAYFERAAALERRGDISGSDRDYARAHAIDPQLGKPGTYVVGTGTGASAAAGTSVNGVYRSGNGVTAPVRTHEVTPRYTSAALEHKIQGTVLLESVVGTDGSVEDVHVLRSLDPVYGLDDEAIAAARQWKFQPGTRDGKPVRVSVTVEMAFRIAPPSSVAALTLPDSFARTRVDNAPPTDEQWQEQTFEQPPLRTHIAVPKGWATTTGLAEGVIVVQSIGEPFGVSLARPMAAPFTIDGAATAADLQTLADAVAKQLGRPVVKFGQTQTGGRWWRWVDFGQVELSALGLSSTLSRLAKFTDAAHVWSFVTTANGQLCSINFIVTRLRDAPAAEMDRLTALAGPVFARILERISFEARPPNP